MFFDVSQKPDASLYVSRRKDLVNAIKQELKASKSDILLLFASFERATELFRQDSSFFYLTGIREPGIALVSEMNEKATLYIPNCEQDRTQWMHTPVPLTQENSKNIGVDSIAFLGDVCPGYQFHPFFPQNEYKTILEKIKKTVDAGGKIFTLNPKNSHEYVQQRLLLERIKNFIPGFEAALVDVSALVATMRRKKDMHEIERTYEAVNVTIVAHETAAQAIEQNVSEREIQGALEYVFTAAGGRAAFPSVVASGINGTVLHYTDNNGELKDGDLILIDIGAQVDHYCADITRTYPVSGAFTDRQRELYNAVLETQNYIADLAKPGMWLRNEKEEEKSLHHLAKKKLESKDLGKHFPHGIGHFLGLDVHDVGNYSRPLEPGDLFTIEPGVYIKEENIGIRIEDNFWMGKSGVVCLSEELPKDPDEIEKLMEKETPAE